MNSRTKTQFKTWQALPALPTGRTECPPANPGARVCDPQRFGNTGSVAARRPGRASDGAHSQKLKFIFTTHD
jgi:hypothetical protein